MKKSLLLCTTAILLASGNTIAWGATGVNSTPLRNAVTVANMVKHLEALQGIADANNGERSAATPGYVASLEYIKQKVTAAGYVVSEFTFSFLSFEEVAPATLSQAAPDVKPYVESVDFATMSYSGAGSINNTVVQPVAGIIIPPSPTSTSTSGCTAADFAGFVPGNVALIQRGGCTFAVKAENAIAAGASAVIIFNEGNPTSDDDRIGLLNGTLGESDAFTKPVLGTTFALGAELFTAQPAPARVSLSTSTIITLTTTSNLIADTPTGRDDRIVVAGAHLDSVPGGAGIEDNGSGSAAILEIALQMKKLGIKPRNKVRFAWWGAEEAGLIGSEKYVASLSTTQKKNIAVNLNFDMIASPNYVRFVYDGDGSDTDPAIIAGIDIPLGSDIVEDVFGRYFNSAGLPYEPTAFDGRSDYGPFIAAGIPAGGLFTGADDVKTAAEQAVYGGTAGIIHDPCYHQACDNINNINSFVYDQMGDAAADGILQFAMTTSSVRGTQKANDQAIKTIDSDAFMYRGSHLQK
jgi:Zn-dependent M28 family amino/carboxypeptidase